MENINFKTAINQYYKFQTSRYVGMKAIFDTYIPFVLYKECLERKEKDEQNKISDEKKKNDAALKEIQKDLLMQKSNTKTNKKTYNILSKINEDNEGSDEDSDKSMDPFDLTKDYEKVLNFNLISDEDKDEFRKGRPYPYLNQSLLNIINKKKITLNTLSLKPKHEQLNFQLLSFKFRDAQLNRCPKISFQQNAELFGNAPSTQSNKSSFYYSSENLGIDNNMNNHHIKQQNLKQNNANNITASNNRLSKVKTLSGKALNFTKKNYNKFKSQKYANNNNSFNSSDNDENEKDTLKIKDKIIEKEDDESNFEKNSFAKESESSTLKKDKLKSAEIKFRPNFKKYSTRSKMLQTEVILKQKFLFKTKEGQENKFLLCDMDIIKEQSVKVTLQSYFLDEDLPEKGNKIAIPSDDMRKELFIFNPIDIDLVKGNLNDNLVEESLKKRAKLLFPYRQNDVKIMIIKLLQFLFIIKSKIANKKNLKVSNLLPTNGKMKLKEIKGSNIITFNEVKPFMQSKFGHFNMDLFKEAYEKKIKQNEEAKKAKKYEELQKKFLEILQKDEADRPDYDEDDNMRNEKRRNDANPLDIEKNAKMLLGSVYKPRKKMNYLNGLKMLIKEEAKKNKGNNYKYQ